MVNPVNRASRKPSFLWQGVLILAPVLVLAGIGAYALWKDQRQAMREAEDRAQQLAKPAAVQVWDELEKVHLPLIEFDRAGMLLRPKPYEEIPAPRPLDETELTGDQAKLWNAARMALSVSNRVRLLGEFLKTKPPAEFAALTHFNRGLALEQLARRSEARVEFTTVIENYSGAVSEAGLPLDFLARAHVQTRAEFVRYAVEHPCSVTSQIVAEFADDDPEGESIGKLWSEQEQLRKLAAVARQFFKTNDSAATAAPDAAEHPKTQVDAPPMFWVSTFEEDSPTNNVPSRFVSFKERAEELRGSVEKNWLLIRTIATNGFALGAQPEAQAIAVAKSVLLGIARPEWLDFTVSAGGRGLITANTLFELKLMQGGKASGQYWKPMVPAAELPVMATGRRAERGDPLGVTVSAVLVSRELLLFQQNQRTAWFGLVIAVAAGASVVGFVSAYRAFHKQHRLAEMKSNFVSGVSHELRAPIASIRLLAEGLERGKVNEPAKQQEYFKFIGQECRRLSSMIENVLDFARIEQGRKQYEFEPVDVAAVVEQTLKLMEPYAAERGVRLVRRIERKDGGENQILLTSDAAREEEFAANLDAQAIQQALVNLIDNAIKHSPAGTDVLVKLAAEETNLPPHPGPLPQGGEGDARPPRAYIQIAVEDRGPGIPATEHEKIFERFYRLGSELRRETQGVGIGLTIVKHIIEAHGGRVLVESEVGKGSRFTMELPVERLESERLKG